jgi:hypothetical protein
MRTRSARRCFATATRSAARRDRRRQHLLRDERGGAQVAPGRVARGADASARVRDRLRANLERAFDGLPENVTVVSRVRRRPRRSSPATSARSAASRPTRGSTGSRVRARPGRVQLLVHVLRDPARPRALAEPERGGVLREVGKRVEQGHREVVSTGINLGCFRDREGGYTLCAARPRGPGRRGLKERLRLSSIEVNHVNDELVSALRETPTVSKHLHVPLQSGDDRVLSAMGRRYTVATYLRATRTARDFNLTADVNRRLSCGGRAGFEETRRVLAAAGVTEGARVPVLRRARGLRPGRRSRARRRRSGRSAQLRADSHEACLQRWRSKVGATDAVLVDRPAAATATTTRRGCRRVGSGRRARAGARGRRRGGGIVGAV